MVCAVTLAAASVLTGVSVDGESQVARVIPAVILLIATSTVAARQMARCVTALWSPVFWLLITCALYFGFGPLVYLLGHPEAVERMDAYYYVSDAEFGRVARLNLLAVALALGSAALTLGRRAESAWTNAAARTAGVAQARHLWWIFLALGGVVKVAVALPYSYGVIDGIPLGSVVQLKQMISAAIVCLALLVACGERRYLSPLIVVVTFEVLTAVLEFNKLALLLVPLAVLLGMALGRPQARRGAVSGGCGVLGLYLLLSPFIGEARNALAERTGRFWAGSVEERLGAAGDAFGRLRAPGRAQAGSIQGWWTRLSYVNAQALAMAEYDSGRGGTSLQEALVILVPRALWPAKPNITDVAAVFDAIAKGRYGSASSPTVIGEGYWNWGWLGVAVVSIAVGLLLGAATRFASHALSSGSIVFTPVLLILVRMGIRIDGWFVTDYLGAAGLALASGFGIEAIWRLGSGKSSRLVRRQVAPERTAVRWWKHFSV